VTEAELTPKILLALCGTGEVLLERNNIGSGYLVRDQKHTPQQERARFGKYGYANPGGADYVGVYKGRALYVELKTPEGRQSPEQRQFQQRVERHGAIYRILRSVEDAHALLVELRALPEVAA
jgi:hypothetical protein